MDRLNAPPDLLPRIEIGKGKADHAPVNGTEALMQQGRAVAACPGRYSMVLPKPCREVGGVQPLDIQREYRQMTGRGGVSVKGYRLQVLQAAVKKGRQAPLLGPDLVKAQGVYELDPLLQPEDAVAVRRSRFEHVGHFSGLGALEAVHAGSPGLHDGKLDRPLRDDTTRPLGTEERFVPGKAKDIGHISRDGDRPESLRRQGSGVPWRLHLRKVPRYR